MLPPVKLRGHHLLCILTYKGLGYSEAFIANFDTVVERINQGAEIEIVHGVDDICRALQVENSPCSHAAVCVSKLVQFRDRKALWAIAKALQIPPLRIGERLLLTAGDVRHLRNLFAQNKIRHACIGCPWFQTCSDIAVVRNFSDVALMPDAIPSFSHLLQRASSRSSLDQ